MNRLYRGEMMKPTQLTVCIHRGMLDGLEADELARMLCLRFGGAVLPDADSFDRGMEELRGVERTAREILRRPCDGQ